MHNDVSSTCIKAKMIQLTISRDFFPVYACKRSRGGSETCFVNSWFDKGSLLPHYTISTCWLLRQYNGNIALFVFVIVSVSPGRIVIENGCRSKLFR